MPPVVAYGVATLPALPKWESSPFDLSTRRLLGRVRIESKSWRHAEARGTVQIISMLHPRPVNINLEEKLFALLDNLQWLQRAQVENPQRFQLTIGGETGEARGITVVASATEGTPIVGIPGIPLRVFERRVHILAVAWKVGRLGEYGYVGTAVDETKDEVWRALPSNVEYDEVRFPLLQ